MVFVYCLPLQTFLFLHFTEALADPPVGNNKHAPRISKVEFEVKKKDHINSRALEMFQTGQGADCVIEVVPQTDGQEKQVGLIFFFIGEIFSRSCPLFPYPLFSKNNNNNSEPRTPVHKN
jgi:hypothetical protein